MELLSEEMHKQRNIFLRRKRDVSRKYDKNLNKLYVHLFIFELIISDPLCVFSN